jgi:hypothetical protein
MKCNYCGKKVEGSYVSDKNFYCNPEHAKLDFEKRMKKKRIDIEESLHDKEMIEHSQKLMRINQKGWERTKNEPFTI